MEDTWKKHIQALSVFQWVLTFVFMGSFFTILLLYLMFTSLWIIPVAYFTWLLMDWETPERAYPIPVFPFIPLIHLFAIFTTYMAEFPLTIQLVQSSLLSPDRNYVLGCHPHGIMSVAAFSNFATEANGFSDVYPGVRPWLAVLAGMFRLPIYRDYIMSAGVVPVSRDSIQYLLSRCGTGNAVFIVVGGAAESLQSSPAENMVTLSGRKGFVRLALQNGADLVPVYSFGENHIFEQVHFSPGSWGWRLQLLFQKHVGFAPCLFYGRGVFNADSWGFNPIPRPLTTVVGRPIRVPHCPVPSEEDVSHYHSLYIQGLQQLFDEYKVYCGLSETDTLRII